MARTPTSIFLRFVSKFPHFPCHASYRQHRPLLTYLFLLGGASLMSLWSPGRGQVLWQGWAGLSLRRNSEWVMATAAQNTSQLMKPACDSSRIIYTLPCHALCLSPQHTSLYVHLSSSARTKIRMRGRVILCIGMLQCNIQREIKIRRHPLQSLCPPHHSNI